MNSTSHIISLDARHAAARPAAEQLPDPIPSAQVTLVDQLTEWVHMRIDERVFRAGMRMPSIRQLTQEKSISRFIVVETYERLVARGYLESRRGLGFYVKECRAPLPEESIAPLPTAARKIDVIWLLRNVFHSAEPHKAPGISFLPNGWLDGELIANVLRTLGRWNGNQFLAWGSPQGFLPLRQQLQTQLAELKIDTRPEQIVMTSGITSSLDLITRQYVQPGDTVLVSDPVWFLMFGRFTAQGAQVIGVSCTAEGPDLMALEGLMQVHRPKLLIINSILHSPTGTSLPAAKASQLLRLAGQYGFLVVEGDIYGDLTPPGHSGIRLASLDQLRRVIYLSSFSKTFAASLCVEFIICHPELAKSLVDSKLLTGLVTPEIIERMLYKILAEGYYRKHVERIRTRLDRAHDGVQRSPERMGLKLFAQHGAGMFLWADMGQDTNAIARAGYEQGYMFAPGSLFSLSRMPSTWMRFNIATNADPDLFRFLAGQLDRGA